MTTLNHQSSIINHQSSIHKPPLPCSKMKWHFNNKGGWPTSNFGSKDVPTADADKDALVDALQVPNLYTLNPAQHVRPCTLHPAPCTLHPAPCTLHPAFSTLRPAP
jgi:hypothetical protein